MTTNDRLTQLGLRLPALPRPLANYVGAVRCGSIIYLAGHIPIDEHGKPAFAGKVGAEVSTEDGYQAARLVALNLLGTLQNSLDDLDQVRRIVKVLGFVNAAQGYRDLPKVMNGFSDIIVEIFGEARGRHARSAVGVAELPLNVPVEIEMVVEVE